MLQLFLVFKNEKEQFLPAVNLTWNCFFKFILELILKHRRSREVAEQAQRMEELKTEWLGILNALVENINQRFSRFFSILDFAGEVRLTHGAHDNDFENYGLKIFVTYREREPLQVG
jgi:hypothetical protein